MAFDEIVSGAGLHGLDIDLMFSLAGKKDHGRLATALDRFAQQFHTIARPQPIVDKADVVLIGDHRSQPLVESAHPLDVDGPSFDFTEQAAREDIIILIILHKEHFQRFAWVRAQHYLTGNSTMSNQ